MQLRVQQDAVRKIQIGPEGPVGYHLYGFSDNNTQMLFMSPYFWGDILVLPSDIETQPIWVYVQKDPNIDASYAIKLSPDAVRQLLEENYAEVELAIAPDASVVVKLGTAPFAEATLSVGQDARALVYIKQDGSAELILAKDAEVMLDEPPPGEATLTVKSDAEKTIDIVYDANEDD